MGALSACEHMLFVCRLEAPSSIITLEPLKAEAVLDSIFPVVVGRPQGLAGQSEAFLNRRLERADVGHLSELTLCTCSLSDNPRGQCCQ